ncbi:MAG: ilvB, partial [Massilia sp.]|nr:ilvB [Massilia sp.]
MNKPTDHAAPPEYRIGNTDAPPGVTPAAQRWASDVIIDLVHQYKLPYAAVNPGASYRGLHDSIINYGQNYPHMMLCQHEETAVQIAHGYAKA